MNALLALSFLFGALGAEVPAQDPGASQRDIDRAVQRGLEYLKTAASPGGHLKGDCDELILLTLIHGGVSDKNPRYERLLKNVLQKGLEHTYNVALMAMCLEEIDPTYYQGRIAQCGQFLADNQATNGQWSYGRATDYSKIPAPSEPPDKKDVQSGARPAVRDFGAKPEKKKPSKVILIKQAKTTGEKGDNSNTQYAALGLRACWDANVRVNDEVYQLARKWLVDSQHPDEGGAAKAGKEGGKDAVASGGEITKIQGWNYTTHGGDGNEARAPYHAMTAGAVGAVVIYDYILGKDWKKDVVAVAGANWLGKHFAVNTNYYYMYGLERAGMLYNTEKFGDKNWYWEGVKVLLPNQNGDGSWGKRENKDENTWDTCFAILFLKKATKGVATGDGRR